MCKILAICVCPNEVAPFDSPEEAEQVRAALEDTEYRRLYTDSRANVEAYLRKLGWRLTSFPPRKADKLGEVVTELFSIYSDGASAEVTGGASAEVGAGGSSGGGAKPACGAKPASGDRLPHTLTLAQAAEGGAAVAPASEAPPKPEKQASSTIDNIRNVQKMQLGTQEEVRELLQQRAIEWSDEKLEQIRRKDAAWAWAYSRYFYRGGLGCCSLLRLIGRGGNDRAKARALFDADLRETALMVLMVRALRGGDADRFELLYPAYLRTNREKYGLMLADPNGLVRVTMSIVLEKYGPSFGAS